MRTVSSAVRSPSSRASLGGSSSTGERGARSGPPKSFSRRRSTLSSVAPAAAGFVSPSGAGGAPGIGESVVEVPEEEPLLPGCLPLDPLKKADIFSCVDSSLGAAPFAGRATSLRSLAACRPSEVKYSSNLSATCERERNV